MSERAAERLVALLFAASFLAGMIATEMGLDVAKVKDAIAKDKYKAAIEADQSQLDDLGASGTPQLYVNGRHLAGAPLDAALEAHLNADFGPGSETYDALFDACKTGVADGWLCNREGGGIRYGRVLKASDATHGYSVDVVDMNDLAGPHHSHPNGEIDLIMPLTPGARFDGCPAGWSWSAAAAASSTWPSVAAATWRPTCRWSSAPGSGSTP